MSDSMKPDRLLELQQEVAREKGVSPDTLRRLLAKVDQYSESHRADGLSDDLLNILSEDLRLNPDGKSFEGVCISPGASPPERGVSREADGEED